MNRRVGVRNIENGEIDIIPPARIAKPIAVLNNISVVAGDAHLISKFKIGSVNKIGRRRVCNINYMESCAIHHVSIIPGDGNICRHNKINVHTANLNWVAWIGNIYSAYFFIGGKIQVTRDNVEDVAHRILAQLNGLYRISNVNDS